MPAQYLPFIVIIDDDEDDRELLSSALELQGCTVQTFDAGDHAIDALKLMKDPMHLPSLIILDYNMPRINGEQVLSFLKSEHIVKDVHIVIYSTSLSDMLKNALVKVGAHSCMIKPNNEQEFDDQVLKFKEIAQSRQKPPRSSRLRTSFKFFSKISSFKKTNQSIALKEALEELCQDA
jgi:two-component system chemotaxis response regulator CheY